MAIAFTEIKQISQKTTQLSLTRSEISKQSSTTQMLSIFSSSISTINTRSWVGQRPLHLHSSEDGCLLPISWELREPDHTISTLTCTWDSADLYLDQSSEELSDTKSLAIDKDCTTLGLPRDWEEDTQSPRLWTCTTFGSTRVLKPPTSFTDGDEPYK